MLPLAHNGTVGGSSSKGTGTQSCRGGNLGVQGVWRGLLGLGVHNMMCNEGAASGGVILARGSRHDATVP